MHEPAHHGKLSLVEENIRAEMKDRKRELDFKEREIELKEQESRRSRWTNPLVIAIFGTAVGLIGNLFAYTTSLRNERAKRIQYESALMLDAIKTGDPVQSCKNLLFLSTLGCLQTRPGAVRKACEVRGNVLPIPQSNGSSAAPSTGSPAPGLTKPEHH